MAVCAEYHIPHSQFLAWDQDDRDKAIWFHARKAEACPSCGTRPDEWEHDHNAYVGKAIRCRGCEVRQRTEDGLQSIKDELGKGIHVVLQRRKDGD